MCNNPAQTTVPDINACYAGIKFIIGIGAQTETATHDFPECNTPIARCSTVLAISDVVSKMNNT